MRRVDIKIYTSIIAVFLTGFLSAQKYIADKVVLDNGVEFVGLLEAISGDSVALIVKKDQRIIIPKDLIVNHQHVLIDPLIKLEKPYQFKEKGLFQKLEVGVFPPNSALEAGVYVGYSLGFSFHRLFRVGLGAGLEHRDGSAQVPFYLDLTSYLSRANKTFFFNIKAGKVYSFDGQSNGFIDTERRYFFNPQLGLRFSGREKFNSQLAVGMRWDYYHVRYDESFWLVRHSRRTIQATLGYQLAF